MRTLKSRFLTILMLLASLAITSFAQTTGTKPQPSPVKTTTTEVSFKSFDGYDMFGKLTLPDTPGRHPIVIYAQTAEGMTVDMKRPGGKNGTFNYFDLYREKLPEMNVGFFGYEGRGIRMGDSPPRYEKIDWDIYNTSTLENKVRDLMSAIEVVRKQKGVDTSQIFLIGASEGTLLAAEAASRVPKQVKGLMLYGVLTSNMRENYKYLVTDGAYVAYLTYFDSDKDGKISTEEFEQDRAGFRKRSLPGIKFSVFDRNGDGVFTVDERRELSAGLVKAADTENWEVLNSWLKVSAAVATPKGWFQDHFAHKPIWEFLSKLNQPIGFFQGAKDSSVPIAGVHALEERAKQAGKKNWEFYYFDNLDHSLNIGVYFYNGKIPDGHKAIFEFVKNHTRKK